MKRIKLDPRSNWLEKNNEVGFDFSFVDGDPYWIEDHCYEFKYNQILELEKATQELISMCYQLVEFVIKDNLFEKLRIPQKFWEAIKNSWYKDDFSIYGRFDFYYDGVNPPKLLEFNADTPTALLESSIVQWKWLEEQSTQLKNNDQFNSIHEKLIESWSYYKKNFLKNEILHFTSFVESLEDYRNVEYMMDTAYQAGITVKYVPINEIGSDGVILVDQEDQEIKHLFKLYPYEWMMNESFADVLINPPCNLIEPLWKTILSNKAMLVLLWELYPNHQYLLETSFSSLEKEYVKKPIYGREGSNIFIKTSGLTLETEFNSLYNSTGYVYQEAKILPIFDKKYAQVCSWIVGDDSAGICIREDDSPVIGNLSTFVPHYFF